MFSLFKKKYALLDKQHIHLLQEMERFIKSDKLHLAIDLGLKERKNINCKGDAFIFFYTYFIFRTNECLELRREMAELMTREYILQYFNDIDRQYIIDVSASLLKSFGGNDFVSSDNIFKLSKGFPDPKGVDPTILHFCRVVKLD